MHAHGHVPIYVCVSTLIRTLELHIGGFFVEKGTLGVTFAASWVKTAVTPQSAQFDISVLTQHITKVGAPKCTCSSCTAHSRGDGQEEEKEKEGVLLLVLGLCAVCGPLTIRTIEKVVAPDSIHHTVYNTQYTVYRIWYARRL